MLWSCLESGTAIPLTSMPHCLSSQRSSGCPLAFVLCGPFWCAPHIANCCCPTHSLRRLPNHTLHVIFLRNLGPQAQQILQDAVPKRRSHADQQNGQHHARILSWIFQLPQPAAVRRQGDDPNFTQQIVV